jgi:hypothetical protein
VRLAAALFESMGGRWGPEIKAACMGLRIDEMAEVLVRLAARRCRFAHLMASQSSQM